ncbi:MAG TPA: GtrA family protein [Pseudonocardiaceae bacterium]|jgi:putative flippase GtrA
MSFDLDKFHIGRFNLGRILRFAIVGVINTGTFYVLYLLFKKISLPYFLAYTVAFILAMIGSYFLNCYFTFKVKPTWKKFLLFPLSNLANYVITSVGLVVLVHALNMNTTIAPLVAAAIAIPITYVVVQYLLVDLHKKAAGTSDAEEAVADQLVQAVATDETEVGEAPADLATIHDGERAS